ncbi:hypothetical protein [Methylibium rhizosphaerae]|nr:hypothetical protein [Methylibium rhizosphaerae]
MTWPHEEPFDTDIEGRWAQGRYDTPAQGLPDSARIPSPTITAGAPM